MIGAEILERNLAPLRFRCNGVPNCIGAVADTDGCLVECVQSIGGCGSAVADDTQVNRTVGTERG